METSGIKKATPEQVEKCRETADKTKDITFVVFMVTQKEWDEYYSKGNYCHMGIIENKVKVGTFVLGTMKNRMIDPTKYNPNKMTEEEELQYQRWCEANRIYPRPMEIA